MAYVCWYGVVDIMLHIIFCFALKVFLMSGRLLLTLRAGNIMYNIGKNVTAL